MSTDTDKLYPFAVSPKVACRMLDCGPTRLFELIRSGEVQSFKDGRNRKITVASINGRHDRLLAESRTTKPAPVKSKIVRTSDDSAAE
jgi:hypothetical protein